MSHNSIAQSWLILEIARPVRMQSANESFCLFTRSMQLTSTMNPFPNIPITNPPIVATRKVFSIPDGISVERVQKADTIFRWFFLLLLLSKCCRRRPSLILFKKCLMKPTDTISHIFIKVFLFYSSRSSEIYARRSTPIALNGKLEFFFQSHTSDWAVNVPTHHWCWQHFFSTCGDIWKGKSDMQRCKCETDFFTLICTSFLNRNLMPFGFKFLNFNSILRK